MKKQRRAIILAAAALPLLLAAAAFCIVSLGIIPRCLTLRDAENGRVYAAYPLAEGEVFSIEFIHSVNQNPVIDYYEARGKDFYLTQTLYYSYGAGVQTELNPGEVMTTTPDGGMLISNINIKGTGTPHLIGTVSDHILEIGGRTISLRDLCGRNAMVNFDYEYRLFHE